MLKQAVAYYHEPSRGQGTCRCFAPHSRRRPRAKQADLWRTAAFAVPAAAFCYGRLMGGVTDDVRDIWGALQKVKDAAVEERCASGRTGRDRDRERAWSRSIPAMRRFRRTARLDSFLTEDSYSFVELNGESPAGVAYADSATEIFESMPVMKKFAERYKVRGIRGAAENARGFASLLRGISWPSSRKPTR